jgi:hypothetical protein
MNIIVNHIAILAMLMRKIDYLCKWVSKCKVIESRDEDHLHVFLQYVSSRPTISLFMENNINRFNAGSVYIRRRTYPLPRGRRIYTLCHVSAYIALLRLPVAGIVVHSLQNNTALPPGYTPTSCTRSLRACARESGCPLNRWYCLLRSSSACFCSTEPLLTLYTFS